jgi:SEC-C motif domain protein
LRQGIKTWAQQVRFVKLEVLKTVRGMVGDKTGKVEFIAFYMRDGAMLQHHELSIFKKLKGCWYYLYGEDEGI